MRKLFLPLIMGLLASCRPIEKLPPPPTPEHILVVYTPALGWMAENMHQCALDQPEVALTIEERPSSAFVVGAAEATLVLGAPPEGFTGTPTMLGWEQIVVISDPNIAVTQLEVLDLIQIYTSLEPAYQAWSYPENSELREIFDESLLDNREVSPHTQIAPHPGALLESFEGEIQGVGYVPQSWLSSENIQLVPLDDESTAALQQPVLALTLDEPQGVMRIFLRCLTDRMLQEGVLP